MLTEKAIAGLKAYIDRTIVYARYKINGTYYKAPISRREYLKDGRVAVYFSIIPQLGQDVTITEVQLFDTTMICGRRKRKKSLSAACKRAYYTALHLTFGRYKRWHTIGNIGRTM